MAMAHSVTYGADSTKLWGAIVKIVSSAGYTIAETNEATKQLVYKASGGGFAGAQLVTVSASKVEENETIVTVLCEAERHATLMEGGQQQKLIEFMFDQLGQQFPRAANQPQIANAPGTAGCFGMLLFLLAILSIAAGAFTVT